MNAYDYEIDVRPLSQNLGGGYVALVPELPGCMADGETPEEALTSGYDAVACWIETATKIGRPIPEPKRAFTPDREYA